MKNMTYLTLLYVILAGANSAEQDQCYGSEPEKTVEVDSKHSSGLVASTLKVCSQRGREAHSTIPVMHSETQSAACDVDAKDDACADSGEITFEAAAVGSRYIRVQVFDDFCFQKGFALIVWDLLGCGLYVQADGRLGLDKVIKTARQWGAVYIHGERIVPNTFYGIQVLFEEEPGHDLASFSTFVRTWSFGDVNGDNIADDNDIQEAVDAYGGQFTPPTSFYSVNVHPCEPGSEHQIQTGDILEVIRAASGATYTDRCDLPDCYP